MITKTVPLKYLTSIRQSGYTIVNYIENDKEFIDDKLIIGCGSNILIKNTKKVYKLSPNFSYIESNGNTVRVGGSTTISQLTNFMINHSLSCIEFLSGIPASVGGAVFMNAGAFGKEISDFLEYVVIKTPEKKLRIDKPRLNFSYRNSNLNGTILEIGIKCKKSEKNQIIKKIVSNIKIRKNKTHLRNTFGSVFKNPKKGLPAGKLIEECGLKGRAKGTAMISPKHGNFIIGKGLVNIDDVLFLIDLAKNEVLKRFSLELEEEVRII